MTEKNSKIVEMASNLALMELVHIHNLLPEQLMAEDGESYQGKYQDEFDEHYDTYFSQLRNL
ncbi:MAG: hypothetical protein SNJ29_16805 [Rikenellaceae bacterium]